MAHNHYNITSNNCDHCRDSFFVELLQVYTSKVGNGPLVEKQ